MPAAQELAVIFKVVDQASPVLRSVGGKVKAFSANAKTSIKGIGKSVFNLKTAFAALGVFVAVRVAKQFVESFKAQEFAIARLNAALKASGSFTQEATDQIQEHSRAMQVLTTFTDDAILAASAMLATFKLESETIKELTSLALDMSAATGMDLRAASILLGKAAVGVTGELSRYGIIIDRVAYKQRGLAVVIEEVNKEFGGTARALRETPLGILESTAALWGDMREEIGKFIVLAITPFVRNLHKEMGVLLKTMESADLGAWATNASKGFEKFTPSAERMLGVIISIVKVTTVLSTAFKSIIKVSQLATRLMGLAWNTLGLAFLKVKETFQVGFEALIKGFTAVAKVFIQSAETIGGALGISTKSLRKFQVDLEVAASAARLAWVETGFEIEKAQEDIEMSLVDSGMAALELIKIYEDQAVAARALAEAERALDDAVSETRQEIAKTEESERALAELRNRFTAVGLEYVTLLEELRTQSIIDERKAQLVAIKGFMAEEVGLMQWFAFVTQLEREKAAEARKQAEQDAHSESIGALRRWSEETFGITTELNEGIRIPMDDLSDRTFGIGERMKDVLPEAFGVVKTEGTSAIKGLVLESDLMLERMGANFDFLATAGSTAMESLGVATEAWGEQFEAVALGAKFSAKSMARAMKEGVSKQIATIAKDASIRALRSVAYGLFALAMGDVGGAGKFFAAAAKFGVLAGAAVATARAVAPGEEAAAEPAAAARTARREELPFGPERRLATGGVAIGAQRQFNVNVVIEGNVINNDQFVRDLSDSIREAVGDNVQFGLTPR